MYLPKPLYEGLPYVYLLLGPGLLALSWRGATQGWPTAVNAVLALGGVVAVIAGLILWLRRRDFRDRATHYDPKALDREL
jgi:hypothetical protein